MVCIDRVLPRRTTRRAGVTYIKAEIADYDVMVNSIRGCDALIHMAAIPAPGRHPDHEVHNNNVVTSYNALRASVEVGIERVCQASSVNATGLAYSRWPRFDYFPLDELHPTYNEDPIQPFKMGLRRAGKFIRAAPEYGHREHALSLGGASKGNRCAGKELRARQKPRQKISGRTRFIPRQPALACYP